MDDREMDDREMDDREMDDREVEQWNQFIQSQPQDAMAYVRRGMAHFKRAHIEASIRDFDQADRLDPRMTPYLWQRGLSLYYAERFEAGAKQFEIDLTVNARDVEETVWRYLCMARYKGVAAARQNLLMVRDDPRQVMRGIYHLYAGHITPEELLDLAMKSDARSQFYSDLYIGLYHEAEGNTDSAKAAINQAVQRFRETYKTDDYMGHLAIVHQRLRGWA